jgi:hypothetical protein
MQAALFSPLAREALVKRGRERVDEFTWDRAANNLVTLFHEVVETAAARSRRRFAAPASRELELVVSPGRVGPRIRPALG